MNIKYAPEKGVTREHNIAHAQRSSLLFSQEERVFLCDWLELADQGTTYKQYRELFRADRGRFIGVDRDSGKIAALQEEHPEGRCEWRLLEDLFLELDDRPSQFEKVGIMNCDTLNSLNGAAFQKQVDTCVRFAERQFWEIGAFLLILNYSHRYMSRSDAERYLNEVLRYHGIVDVQFEDHLTVGASRHSRLNLRLHFGLTWDRF